MEMKIPFGVGSCLYGIISKRIGMYSRTGAFPLITGVSASKEMLCYEKFEMAVLA